MTEPILPRAQTAPPSRGVRLAWLIPGAILAVAALGWGTYNVLTLLAHEERTERAAFAAEEVRSIDIASENGFVKVTGADTDEIVVTADISDGWTSTDVAMHVVDGVLEVRGSCSVLGNPWCSSDFTIVVPADLPVRVDASNGSVEASGLHGSVDLDTDNGRVEFADVSGTISVSNDNGRIVGRRIGASTVSASTDNGRIELTFTAPPDDVRARSRNGRIEVAVPDDEVTYRVELSNRGSGSQNIGVRTDPSSPHTIDLATGNGSLSVHRPG